MCLGEEGGWGNPGQISSLSLPELPLVPVKIPCCIIKYILCSSTLFIFPQARETLKVIMERQKKQRDDAILLLDRYKLLPGVY